MFEKVLKTVIKRLIPKQWMAILLMLCIKNHPWKPTTTTKKLLYHCHQQFPFP